MKKAICILTAVTMFLLLAAPALAASSEPVILMNPQGPAYPEYAVAIYTLKAEGTNLTATWYMDWSGVTYTISDIGGDAQPWEAYAGAGYGARKADDGTFSYIFEGIGRELDGAYIWCVIEDGHYSVTSAKTRISVGSEKMPPEIVSIPTELTVEVGDLAEIRCVAKSSDGSNLSFLWYETDSGRIEDMRAVNRGEETCDTLICDSESVGSRNYICMVESDAGGIIYSSTVKVTVTEKQIISADTDNHDEETTEPLDTTDAVDTANEETNAESIPETKMPEESTGVITDTVNDTPDESFGVPLWLVIIVVLLAISVAVFIAVFAFWKRR